MKRHSIGIALAAFGLMGCQVPAAPTLGGADTPVGTSGSPRPLPSYAPPQAVAPQAVLTLEVMLKPEAGGATMADLDRDEDANDDFKPEIPVIFKAPGYGEAASAANGDMRVRGHSTRGSRQKSYTIKLGKNEPRFRGSRHVFLNKHPYDLTRLRNKLSFDLFAGLPSLLTLKTQFAHLTVDGTDFGLFTQVERPDEVFLAARGLDANGHLYKAEQFEFHRYADKLKLKSEAGYDEKAFESVLEIEGENDDHTRLLAMLEAVNDESVPINTTIDQHFDRENYLTWLAVNLLVGNLDTNSQNFLLYAPAGAGRWQFIPWDYDGAWGFWEQPDNLSSPYRPGRWQDGLANWWSVALHRRFLKEPANVAELTARVEDLAARYFTPDRIRLHLDSYRETVRTYVSRDPDLRRLPAGGGDAMAAWEAEVRRLPDVIQANLARFRQGLERPMPVYLGNPRAEAGGTRFNWDASYDLQGDALTYDFQISRTPDFASLVVDKPGLSETRIVLTEALPAGDYYWRVIVRDAKNPAGHWQTPFDSHHAQDRVYRGLQPVTLPLQ